MRYSTADGLVAVLYCGPMSTTIPGFHAVVPAGGAGTRLWPLSRAGHPKFLLDLTGSGRTLLQATVDRLLPLTGDGGVLVVTGARHAEADDLRRPVSSSPRGLRVTPCSNAPVMPTTEHLPKE